MANHSARALLATIRAGQRQIDAMVQRHLPVERAIAFTIEQETADTAEVDLFKLVNDILDREVDIWRRSFAARLAHQAPPDSHVAARPQPANNGPPLSQPSTAQAVPDEPQTAPPELESEDADIAWVVEGRRPDSKPEPEPEPEPEPATPSSGMPFEDEIDRLVLEELERAREEQDLQVTDDSELQDVDDAIQHLLSGPDPLTEEEELAEPIDEASLVTGDELDGLITGLDDPASAGARAQDTAHVSDAISGPVDLGLEEDSIAPGEDFVLGLDNLLPEDEASAAEPPDLRDFIDSEEVISFDDAPAEGDERVAPREPDTDEDIRHLLDEDAPSLVDRLDSMDDDIDPSDLFLYEGPDEEVTVMARSPLLPPDPLEEATMVTRGPIVFVPQADTVAPPSPALAGARSDLLDSDGDHEQAMIQETHTPSWSRRGEPEPKPAAPRAAAAVQLLGSLGKARMVGHTLELESADELPAEVDEQEEDSDISDDDGLSVTLEEEYEELEAIPMLTDSAAPVALNTFSGTVEDNVSEDEVVQALRKAVETENRGDLQSSIVLFSDVIDLEPVNTQARLGRGRCLMKLGDYAAAMSDFQRAEDLAPESGEPHFEMGNLFYARKDYRRSITFYTQAINANPHMALARVRRGMSFFYRRDYDKALADLEQAKAIDPSMPGLSASINKVMRAQRG